MGDKPLESQAVCPQKSPKRDSSPRGDKLTEGVVPVKKLTEGVVPVKTGKPLLPSTQPPGETNKHQQQAAAAAAAAAAPLEKLDT